MLGRHLNGEPKRKGSEKTDWGCEMTSILNEVRKLPKFGGLRFTRQAEGDVIQRASRGQRSEMVQETKVHKL